MNETLRRAIFSAGLSEDDVAARLGVDPKTVRRWVDGRLPYPRLRWDLAALLEVDETDLWPELLATRTATTKPAEVVSVYPHRSSIPRDFWYSFFNSASGEIKILACSSAFIAEDNGLVQLLLSKARSGVKVRVALSDPDWCPAGEHGRHELIDATRGEAAIRNALVSYRPLMESPDAEIRLHRTVLTNSIYRSDKDILVNQHAYGVANADAPVLHLRGDETSEIVGGYLTSLERIWSKAVEPGFWALG
jgi:transcriptional regulator with XRE-family HTH domain